MDQDVLNSALDYLDRCTASGELATLVEMWRAIDYYQRAHLPTVVVNEALRLRPPLYVHRIGNKVVFNQNPGEHEVTEEDVKKNFDLYSSEFWATYQQLPGT